MLILYSTEYLLNYSPVLAEIKWFSSEMKQEPALGYKK